MMHSVMKHNGECASTGPLPDNRGDLVQAGAQKGPA
jgi:hypothetical protein